MREHLKAVVWPRQKTGKPDKVDVNGKPIYRYVIVGMLVTDRELSLSHENEVIVDGGATTIGIQLEGATQRETEYPLGDATDVLLALEDL